MAPRGRIRTWGDSLGSYTSALPKIAPALPTIGSKSHRAPTTKLTRQAVDLLKLPDGRVEYRDSQLPGFGFWILGARFGSRSVAQTVRPTGAFGQGAPAHPPAMTRPLPGIGSRPSSPAHRRS